MCTFIRAPEYFPRLEYMAFLLRAEHIILADTFAYSRQAFMNRMRIRTPQGWQWLTVPVGKGQKGTSLYRVAILPSEVWGPRHWRALLYNYRSTPYFAFYADGLQDFYVRSWNSLGALAIASIRWLLEALAWEGVLEVASERYPGATTLAELVQASGTNHLLTLPESLEHDRGLAPEVSSAHFEHPQYHQHFKGFVPGLSLLDALFNYGPDTRYLLSRAIRERSSAASP